MSTKDASASTDATTAAPELYTVNRSQDGAEVRRELVLEDAQSECNILNAQARTQVGLTAAVYDKRGACVQQAAPVYGAMFHGEIARYEVRSMQSNLTVAT